MHLNKSHEIYEENGGENEKDNPNFLLNRKKVKKNNEKKLEKGSYSINNGIINNNFKKCGNKVFSVIEKKKKCKRLKIKKKYNINSIFKHSKKFVNDEIHNLVKNESRQFTSNKKKGNDNNKLNDVNDVNSITSEHYSKNSQINRIENDKFIKDKKNKLNKSNNNNNCKISSKNIEKNALKNIKNRKDKNNNNNDNRSSSKVENKIHDISHNIYNILNILNLPKSDILKRTNKRFAKTLLYLTNGYNTNIDKLFNGSMYKRKYKNNSVIKIAGIQIYSLCKHHLLPFQGVCTIEYIPNIYILGLSKFSRIVDAFSRRLQLQEDLTNDICNIIKKYLKPLIVRVTIVAKHLCINMRGVKEHNSITVTRACCELKNNKYIINTNTNNCFQKECEINKYENINKMNYGENDSDEFTCNF